MNWSAGGSAATCYATALFNSNSESRGVADDLSTLVADCVALNNSEAVCEALAATQGEAMARCSALGGSSAACIALAGHGEDQRDEWERGWTARRKRARWPRNEP